MSDVSRISKHISVSKKKKHVSHLSKYSFTRIDAVSLQAEVANTRRLILATNHLLDSKYIQVKLCSP